MLWAEQDDNGQLSFGTWDTDGNDNVFGTPTSETFDDSAWTLEYTINQPIDVDKNFKFKFELDSDLMDLF